MTQVIVLEATLKARDWRTRKRWRPQLLPPRLPSLPIHNTGKKTVDGSAGHSFRGSDRDEEARSRSSSVLQASARALWADRSSDEAVAG